MQQALFGPLIVVSMDQYYYDYYNYYNSSSSPSYYYYYDDDDDDDDDDDETKSYFYVLLGCPYLVTNIRSHLLRHRTENSCLRVFIIQKLGRLSYHQP